MRCIGSGNRRLNTLSGKFITVPRKKPVSFDPLPAENRDTSLPAIQVQTSATPLVKSKLVWLAIGVAALLAIGFMPPTPGLSTAGQRVLGILTFAVIMWISEAVPYVYTAISSVVLLTLFLGFSPAKDVSGPLLGKGKALQIAVAGFVSNGTSLVTGPLFLTVASEINGLEKRMAIGIS